MVRRFGMLVVVLASLAAPAWAQPGNPFGGAKLPHGGRPEHHVAMPPIHDWSSLKILLERSICYGTCPAYRVEIDGDGSVVFEGGSNVAVQGRQTDHVGGDAVHDLYARFRQADFFWLLDSYSAPITDLPTYRVTIFYDGHSKTVADYAGAVIGMPMAVVDLERRIDDVANTARWIKLDKAP